MMKHPSSSKYDYGQDLPDKGVSPALTVLTIFIISIIILAKMFG
jgi:hypothetical protein